MVHDRDAAITLPAVFRPGRLDDFFALMLGALFADLVDESNLFENARFMHIIHFFILAVFEQAIIQLNVQLLDIVGLDFCVTWRNQRFDVRPNCEKAEDRSPDSSDQTILTDL